MYASVFAIEEWPELRWSAESVVATVFEYENNTREFTFSERADECEYSDGFSQSGTSRRDRGVTMQTCKNIKRQTCENPKKETCENNLKKETCENDLKKENLRKPPH
ncbi:hypothetical protein BY458DRAFT_544200 [Sporodiniella umbellata]|nr:hypothetical protein BY458DRAFT_544197 [Sporodiniella umbellata]KAI9281973.1 hypothetical protein BY458DRAFT_544200 [Sporodiniella umbellata]